MKSGISEIKIDLFSLKTRVLIFIFPILFLSSSYFIFIYSPPVYQKLFGIYESGFFEWVQFLCYFISACFGFQTFQILRKKTSFNTQKLLIILFTLGCGFVSFEEISWGQHIFKWTTPELFSQFNMQNETNIHNLAPIHGNDIQEKAFILVSWIGGLSWLLRRDSGTLTPKDLILTEWHLALYFLPIAVYYTQLNFEFGFEFGLDYSHQETFETMLSIGFLGIALTNLKKTSNSLP